MVGRYSPEAGKKVGVATQGMTRVAAIMIRDGRKRGVVGCAWVVVLMEGTSDVCDVEGRSV